MIIYWLIDDALVIWSYFIIKKWNGFKMITAWIISEVNINDKWINWKYKSKTI